MSYDISYDFYAGKKDKKAKDIFGLTFLDYEFTESYYPEYDKKDFNNYKNNIIEYMEKNKIKIAYCDKVLETGGGFTLIKRYTFVNKKGKVITQKQKYGW